MKKFASQDRGRVRIAALMFAKGTERRVGPETSCERKKTEERRWSIEPKTLTKQEEKQNEPQ